MSWPVRTKKLEWLLYQRLNKERAMKVKVVIHPAEEGGFWAEVPALPGCVSSGAWVDEVETPLRAAIGMHIENLREHGEPRAGANCCGSDGQRRPTTEVKRACIRPTLRTGGIPGAGPGNLFRPSGDVDVPRSRGTRCGDP